METTLKQQNLEDYIEQLYWEFDARRSGYAQWKTCPES